MRTGLEIAQDLLRNFKKKDFDLMITTCEVCATEKAEYVNDKHGFDFKICKTCYDQIPDANRVPLP